MSARQAREIDRATGVQVSGKIREEVSNRFVASPKAVLIEAVLGLSAKRKSLPAWLFYDATGSSDFATNRATPDHPTLRPEPLRWHEAAASSTAVSMLRSNTRPRADSDAPIT